MEQPQKFEDWYKEQQRRFHCGHFDEKQIALSAYIEGGESMKKIIESQKDIEPDIVKFVNDTFWNLIGGE